MVFKDPRVVNHVTCAFPLLGVLPNGDVTICGLSRDDEQLHFGNVLTQSLRRSGRRTRMSLLRSRYLDADSLTGICGDCIFKHSCKGGCRAWAVRGRTQLRRAAPALRRPRRGRGVSRGVPRVREEQGDGRARRGDGRRLRLPLIRGVPS